MQRSSSVDCRRFIHLLMAGDHPSENISLRYGCKPETVSGLSNLRNAKLDLAKPRVFKLFSVLSFYIY